VPGCRGGAGGQTGHHHANRSQVVASPRLGPREREALNSPLGRSGPASAETAVRFYLRHDGRGPGI
jgi:hypothetical protein